ncbi:MAG: homoserine O-acetyltransferase MetX [Acidimicrobiia bacterium]
MATLLPVTGAWKPEDFPGRRQFAALFRERPHALESGGFLSDVTIAYETWGERNADTSNAVLVLHAFSGDSHAAGKAGHGHITPGWWDDLIGPGKAIDTDRFFVVCPNVIGGCQGTTGPSSLAPDGKPFGSRFPVTTVRDQTVIEAALANALGIDRWAAVIGGSMGGMRALEWAVSFPERVARCVAISTCAASSAEQIALGAMQMRAIAADPNFRNGDYYDAEPGAGPHAGMMLARAIGQVSYRSELEFHTRFARLPQGDEDPLDGGRYAIESYLDYHAEKLVKRFDANTYVSLTRAMNHHDVGRHRGGVAAALARITAETTIAGVSSDRLYPLRQQYELAHLIPGVTGVEIIGSMAGHDGFLVEHEAVGKVITRALADA